MSLPTIVTPQYTVQLVSQKLPVVFRPYLVKEEKVFLTAKESTDPKEMERAIVQILTNCTFGKIDIAALPTFDVALLFVQLRAKSVNNVIDLKYRCENKVGDGVCHAVNDVQILLDDVSIHAPEGHQSVIPVTDEITVEFTYPTLGTSPNDTSVLTPEYIARSIKSVVQLSNGAIWETRDIKIEELIAFVESWPITALEKCRAFFDTLPTIYYRTEFKCGKCGYTEPLVFESLLDFFG